MQPHASTKPYGVHSLLFWLAAVLAISSQTFSKKVVNSLYIPGGGFSAFWFTHGYLYRNEDIETHDLFCYSAGCLAAIGALQQKTLDDMVHHAKAAQDSWLQGEITIPEVLETFVDSLLQSPTNKAIDFSRVHIITSQTLSLFPVIRTPTSTTELRTMLIQSAWIPLVSGESLSLHGHMDGGFSRLFHPQCEKVARAPLMDMTILLHALNPALDEATARGLWQRGLWQRGHYSLQSR